MKLYFQIPPLKYLDVLRGFSLLKSLILDEGCPLSSVSLTISVSILDLLASLKLGAWYCDSFIGSTEEFRLKRCYGADKFETFDSRAWALVWDLKKEKSELLRCLFYEELEMEGDLLALLVPSFSFKLGYLKLVLLEDDPVINALVDFHMPYCFCIGLELKSCSFLICSFISR